MALKTLTQAIKDLCSRVTDLEAGGPDLDEQTLTPTVVNGETTEIAISNGNTIPILHNHPVVPVIMPALADPLPDAKVAEVGTSLLYAREDHVHPLAPPVEITCSALRSLGTAGNVVPGQEYLVTDYNRGTVGAATILTHGVTENTVSWNVAVQTSFDDSAWAGRWDPDTCRIIDLFDNRGNNVRSDTGDEVETFPWGETLVSGNDFTDFDFNYNGGEVRDNVGGPTARLDTSGTAQVEQSVINSLATVYVNDARMVRTEVQSRGRVRLDAGARLDDSTVSSYSYLDYEGLQIYSSTFEAYSYLYGDGAVGRIDRLIMNRGYAELRGVADVNIDDVVLESYGRITARDANSVRIYRSSASNSGYIQVNAGNDINMTESSVDGTALVRVLNGSLRMDNTQLLAAARLDQNSTGAYTVTSTVANSAGIIEFLNTTDGNLVDNSSVRNSGAFRFTGTAADGRIHRSDVTSGYIRIQDSNNVLVYYVDVSAIGYLTIRDGSDGFQVQYSSFRSYGRMLVEQGSTGRVLGTQLSSTAYVRLRAYASDLRYSDFDSYFYYYNTGNTAVKQGLNGSGRQTYTEPNPTVGVTGPGVRNW